jgi:hypothetical protein
MTGNWLTGIDEIVKISSTVRGICSGHYIHPTKILMQSLNAETSFIYFKVWCPFKLKKR